MLDLIVTTVKTLPSFFQLNKDYVDEVDPRKLVATAADAMLKSLDPYSEFEATQEQVCVCVHVAWSVFTMLYLTSLNSL